MSEQHTLLLQTLTSLHAGSGKTQATLLNSLLRDSDTGLPQISASTVKGALRKKIRDNFYPELQAQENWKSAANQDSRLISIFGVKEEPESAGVEFQSAQLLALALRSAKNIWCLVCSPSTLQAFAQSLGQELPALPVPEKNQVFCAQKSPLLLEPNSLVIEDLEFQVKGDWAEGLTWLEKTLPEGSVRTVMNRMVLVSDPCLKMLAQSKTEIMDFPGTQKQAQEVEFLPAESILYSPIKTAEHHPALKNLSEHCPAYISLGAYQTLGKGLCAVTLLSPQGEN